MVTISELQKKGLWNKDISPTMELLLEISQRLSLKNIIEPSNLFVIRTVKESVMVKRFLQDSQQLPQTIRENAYILNETGKLLFAIWEFKKAIDCFAMASKYSKDLEQKGIAKFNQFQACIQKGAMQDAIEAYQKSVELLPKLNLFNPDRYKVLEVLGVGWWGVEFLCSNMERDNFSIKCLVADKNIDLQKLEEKLTIITKIDTPFISKIHEVNLDGKEFPPHIIATYTPGTNLTQYISQNRDLPQEESISLLKKLAQGLYKIHNQEIMHLDFKPRNVIIDKNELHPTIINFGLSLPQEKLKEYRIAINKREGSTLSMLAQDIIESSEYGAPEFRNELIEGKTYPVKHYTDIYSFGKVASYMLFRVTRPFPQQLQKLEISDFGEILGKCISENPRNRYQSFSTILYLLSSYKQGYKCYENKEYRKAIQHFQKAIKGENHPLAQFALAAMYEQGEELAMSQKWAQKWRKKSLGDKKTFDNLEEIENSATNGDVIAQSFLAYIYFYGIGVTQDYDKSKKQWEKSANREYLMAQIFLGNMYKDGLGTSKSLQEAANWYRRAANKGSVMAQYMLGHIFQYEMDEPKYQEAIHWFKKAADNEYAPAQTILGYLYKHGLAAVEYYSQAQQWLEEGVEQEYSKAFSWFSKAMIQGYPVAQYHLGSMYFYGLGVEQDLQKAVELFEKSARKNYLPAKSVMSCIVQNGLASVKPDSQKALEWLKNSTFEKGMQKILKDMLQGCSSVPPMEFPMLLKARVPIEDKMEWWVSQDEKEPTIEDIEQHLKQEEEVDYLSDEEAAALGGDNKDTKDIN